MLADAQSRLYELAEEHQGFFTAYEARLAGFKPAHLVTLAVRGQIERRSRGVYRLPLYPRGRYEQLQESVLWPEALNRLAYSLISHSSALELYEISDVSQSSVHVTIPTGSRIRRSMPQWLSLHCAQLTPIEITEHEGVPVTTPFRSIIDAAAANVGPAILAQALQDGFKRGLIKRGERDLLNIRLGLSSSGGR